MKVNTIRNERFAKPYLLYFFLFPFSFFLLLTCHKTPTKSEDKRPQIDVQSPITQNTTWESGNDYIIRGTVTVEENAMLTINRDVNVYFTLDSLGNKGKLEVLGGIHADGVDSTGLIHFEPLNEEDDEAWGVELFEGEDVEEFVFCSFLNLIYGIKSSKTGIFVFGSLFVDCIHGINVSKCDSVMIEASFFDNNEYGIKIELSGSTLQPVKIRDSSFSGQNQDAIEVKNQSHVFFERSLFLNNQIGGYFNQTSNIRMEHCEINDCEVGILTAFQMNCQIAYTLFVNCDIAFHILPDAVFTVTESNIYNNRTWNVLTDTHLSEFNLWH